MKIVDTPIKNIRPYEKNPRKNDKAVKTVIESIQEYGFQQPIVVDSNNVIIAGHTRYAAAKQLGFATVPVLVADTLTPQQVTAYRIMDNRSNENAKWDDALLIEELQQLLDIDPRHVVSEHTGFTEAELNKMFPDAKDEEEIDIVGIKSYRSRTGDIWILGDHKLINGDSTKAEDIGALLGDDKIDLLWEDPPYGIAYESIYFVNASEAVKKQREHKIANDNLDEQQLDKFLLAHLNAIKQHFRPGMPVYWAHDIRFNQQFRQLLETANINVNDTLIWKKNSHSSFMSDHAKIYEPILYGWVRGAEHAWYGSWNTNFIELDNIDQLSKERLIEIIKTIKTNIIECDKEPRNIAGLHPTVKPTKLVAYHIINSSKIGDIVFDGFAGSGATLLAAEKTGRHARCVEFEPKFCDVIIHRWQELTGLQAVRQSDGVKWDDVVPEITETAQGEIDENLSALLELDNVGT